MNKTLIFAIITAYIAESIFAMLYHGQFMMPYYTETASLWRDETSMQNNLHFMYIGNLLMVVFAGLIFAKGYEGTKHWFMEGSRFGILLGGFLATIWFSAHTWMPTPIEITKLWILGSLIEGWVIGLALAAVYRK